MSTNSTSDSASDSDQAAGSGSGISTEKMLTKKKLSPISLARNSLSTSIVNLRTAILNTSAVTANREKLEATKREIESDIKMLNDLLEITTEKLAEKTTAEFTALYNELAQFNPTLGSQIQACWLSQDPVQHGVAKNLLRQYVVHCDQTQNYAMSEILFKLHSFFS